MAEKEGFEPSRQLSHPTPLAGEPLRPLGYFSTAYKNIFLAEREGFEPPVPFDITGFQDQRLQPLGHLSLHNQRALLYQIPNALSSPSAQRKCISKNRFSVTTYRQNAGFG